MYDWGCVQVAEWDIPGSPGDVLGFQWSGTTYTERRGHSGSPQDLKRILNAVTYGSSPRYLYRDLPIAASQKSLRTSYYRNLPIIHPWAMNISGYSKRGVGIFLGFTALGSRLTALKSKTQSLHVQNSAMSHTATVILALLLPGEYEQSLRVSSCRNNKRDRARHSRNG